MKNKGREHHQKSWVFRSTERNVVESSFEDELKELCGSQVVMQHSPVGESAANGIENANQRVQGQVRATKLDLETNIKARLNPSQTMWPWLIESAVHTLLFWRKSGDDGFTAIQRVKGRSTTAPWSRFGERIMYQFEASDEHFIGIPLGVLKARAAIAVPMDRCLRPRRSKKCTRHGDHELNMQESGSGQN